MEYRKLGRTNLKVSVIGLGGGAFYNPKINSENVSKIIPYCISSGINFIDTAENYDETKLTDGLRENRDKVILNSKSTSSDKETMEESIKNSLKKLNTNFIEIYQMQTLMEKDDLKNRIKNGALDAIKEAKQDGKIKVIGFSSHRVPTIIEAIKTNEFDVVEMPYGIGHYESEKAIEVAKKYDVGVIAINVLGGGILVDRNKLSNSGSFMTTKNAMQYVLSNENISTALIGMSSIEHVEENLNAINNMEKLSDEEKNRIQDKVYNFLGKDFCRSCKACMPCDVHGWRFSIDNFLRFQTFYSKYNYKIFINEYQKLPIKANQCKQCGKCEVRCPYDIKIMEELKKTHGKLNLEFNEQNFKKLLNEYFDKRLIDEKILREIILNLDQFEKEVIMDKINSRFMPVGENFNPNREEVGKIILAGVFYLDKNQLIELLRSYLRNSFLYKIKEKLSYIKSWWLIR